MPDPDPDTDQTAPTTPSDHGKATLLGFSPLLSLVFGTCFFNIIIPLILWLAFRDETQRLNRIGKSVLNSQISWTIWAILLPIALSLLILVLMFVLSWFIGENILLGGPIMIAVIILVVIFYLASWLALTVWQGIRIMKGNDETMPLTYRFIK